jgi:hypothetical protein
MKKVIILLFVSLLTLGLNAASWSVKVSQRGGKSTPCGVRFDKVTHNTGNYTETIVCSGRGVNECPSPTHTGGEPGIISIINAVTSGGTEGTLIDYSNLSISIFSNGSYSIEDEAASFDAEIIIFDTIDEMNSYLNNN